MELIQEEKLLLSELEEWSRIDELIWCQKSRIDWLKLGDSNTRFFHAYVKVRQNANAIHRLVRIDDSICVGQAQIKQEIANFYINLMGTVIDELQMVDKIIMNRWPKLNNQQ